MHYAIITENTAVHAFFLDTIEVILFPVEINFVIIFFIYTRHVKEKHEDKQRAQKCAVTSSLQTGDCAFLCCLSLTLRSQYDDIYILCRSEMTFYGVAHVLKVNFRRVMFGLKADNT